MKFFAKNLLRQNSNNRIVHNQRPVTYGSIQIWSTLPVGIRNHSSLGSFRDFHRQPSGQLRHSNQNSSSNEGTFFTGDSSPYRIHSANSEYIDQNVNDNDNTETSTCSRGIVFVGAKNVNDHGLSRPNTVINKIKIAIFVVIWILFTGIFMLKDEKVLEYHPLSVSINESKYFLPNQIPIEPRIGVVLYGAFADQTIDTNNFLRIKVQLKSAPYSIGYNDNTSILTETDDDILILPIITNINHIDQTFQVKRMHTFYLTAHFFEQIIRNESMLQLEISSNLHTNFAFNFAFDPSPIDKTLGVIYAAIILLCLYIMIICEIVDRVFAAIFATTVAIGTLAFMNERPTMTDILSWIDVETLLLLFGMMTLVAILSDTGLFDYLAVYAFKITKGKVWPLINCLCLFTALLSAFLDNVTTLLLIGPVCFRLCEVMKLNPVPILMSMIMFSNIGGALTPIGDPPNIIIASNSEVMESGVDFLQFTIHMSGGIVLVMIQTYLYIRYKFRDMTFLRTEEPQSIRDLREEINSWEHAAAMLSPDSYDACVVLDRLRGKIDRLNRQLKKGLSSGSISTDIYVQTLQDLQQKYPVRDGVLLIKSFVALTFVLICFFCHALPYFNRLSLGWIALLGAILLLILSDRRSIESILNHIEWSTLLFFTALFILMESLAKLGLIDWIGGQTENIILAVNEEARLAVAILIILWVSALVSAFVDNIPLTTMMIRICISLSQTSTLNLPLQPLIWALSFGACLGGNGTIIGASANIVAISVARQHGYHITFLQFFKVAFPAMLGSVTVAAGYLLISHVYLSWQ